MPFGAQGDDDSDDDDIDSQMAEFEGALTQAENLQSEVESAMSDLGDKSSSRGRMNDMFRRFDTQLEPFLSPKPASPASRGLNSNSAATRVVVNSAGDSPHGDEARRLSEINAAKEVSDARIASLEAELSRLRGQTMFDGNARKKPIQTERLNIAPAASGDAPPAYGDVGTANRAVTDAELTVLKEAEQLREVVQDGLEEFVGEGDLESLAWQVCVPALASSPNPPPTRPPTHTRRHYPGLSL